jgi:hypothetical protein
MLVRMLTNKNTHSLPVGMENGKTTLKDILTGFSKVTYILTIQFIDHTSWYLCYKLKSYVCKITYIQVFTELLVITAKIQKHPRGSLVGEC